MHQFKMALLGSVVLLAFQTDIRAQRPEPKIPDPARGYNWKEAARKQKLDAQQIEQLAKDKILVTNQAFKQVFEPYVGSGVPMFITSDSLLNGFHVLYEESIVRLEQANARKLGGILKFIWGSLQTADKAFKGKPQLVAAAKTRAKIVIATAMRLLGEEPAPLDAPLAALVKEEVKRIEAAEGQQKPKWLGPPDPGFMALDYTRYRPRGFYTKTPALQRYFRAVSWLQSIPFRIGNDEELVSIVMMGNGIADSSDYDKKKELDVVFWAFHQFVGPGDDLSLLSLTHTHHSDIFLEDVQGGISRLREEVRPAKHGEAPEINDQLALPPGNPTQAAELSFRVLPSYRTSDAVLFQRTTDPRKFHRDFPAGLEVCAALGSSYARSRLAAKDQGKLLVEIDRCKPLFTGTNLYSEYLNCLEALTAKPEPDAPPFMSGEAWQIKSCQTALGGWAQLRHTWALQAKQSANWLCATRLPPGFVEPVPEFFARMAGLVENTEAAIKEAGVLTAIPVEMASDLRAGADVMDKLRKLEKNADPEKRQDVLMGLSFEEMDLWQKTDSISSSLANADDEMESDAYLYRYSCSAKLTQRLRKLADDVEQGHVPDNPKLAEAMRVWDVDLGKQWRALAMLCRRLESLAHKQLRGVPFNKEEDRLILGYGATLAHMMLYDGNSYIHPNDDAPRVVDVYSNPNVGKVLEVGVARPRAIYVLYPVKGGEILCRGAVMPYYEFTNDSRLTDAEWKSLLGSTKRPKPPDWISPIIAPGGLSAPKLDD